MISTSCFVFGFGGSNGHVSRQIFAFRSSFAICGCEKPLSSTSPSISRVSSSLPPVFVYPSAALRDRTVSLMRSKRTSRRGRSATESTARTAISAI